MIANPRLFLDIFAATNLKLSQLDIDTAFLYAPINEDVYIRQPLGFSDGSSKACYLKRCLCGLKQPPPRAKYATKGLPGRIRVATRHVGAVHQHLPYRKCTRYDRLVCR
jgi:hypothetical protein